MANAHPQLLRQDDKHVEGEGRAGHSLGLQEQAIKELSSPPVNDSNGQVAPADATSKTDTAQKVEKAVDNYKPTEKELDEALNSKDAAKALAKIADRLAAISLAEGKLGQLQETTTGLNNPDFRKALEKYIEKAGANTPDRVDAINKFAAATGEGYYVSSNLSQDTGTLDVEFSKQMPVKPGQISGIFENGHMRPGPAIANNFNLVDPRDKQGTELAAKCSEAAGKIGEGIGLKDPTLRKAVEEFVSKNYLEQEFVDLPVLKKQFADKIDPNVQTEIIVNMADAERTTIRFSKVGVDGKSMPIADIVSRPFLSQTETATALGRKFRTAWSAPDDMNSAMGSLQTALQDQVKEAKTPAEAEHRCRALVSKINEANPNGRLSLPLDFKVNKQVEYEPIVRQKLKLDF